MGSPAAGWRALSCLSADCVAAAPASFVHKACFGSPEQLRLLGGTGILRWLEQAAQMGHSFPRSTTNKAEREGRGSLMGLGMDCSHGSLVEPRPHDGEQIPPVCIRPQSEQGEGSRNSPTEGKSRSPAVAWKGLCSWEEERGTSIQVVFRVVLAKSPVPCTFKLQAEIKRRREFTPVRARKVLGSKVRLERVR